MTTIGATTIGVTTTGVTTTGATTEAAIPSLYDVPRYAALPESDVRWMRETELVRARNRLADVFDDCCRRIEATLARLG